MSGFIVKVRLSHNWKLAWYTGKAGTAYLSADRSDAFIYRTEAEAWRKAKLFARHNPMHTWMTEHANPDDAHNAAAAAMCSELGID